MKRVRVAVPDTQSPFFAVDGVGGGSFMNLCWNFGEALDIEVADLARIIAAAVPGEILIARRIGRNETEMVMRDRANSDAETFARLIPRDEERWRVRRRNR